MTARPSWCPQPRACRCLDRMTDTVCAGAVGDGHGRLCFSFRAAGGATYAFDKIEQTDLTVFRGLVDAIEDDLIARAERGME